MTHTGGISDSIAYAWEITGTYQITVTATNTFGSSQSTGVFVVEAETMEIYLPLILRLEDE